MKKLTLWLITLFILVTVLSGQIFAGDSVLAVRDVKEITYDNVAPVSQAFTSNAFRVYVVGGSTTATATEQVTSSLIQFITTDGLYPGTTDITFADANADTLDELLVILNAIPITTPGAEGGIIATRVQGAYGDNPSTQLTVAGPTGCLAAGNAQTLVFANTRGISYVFAAPTATQDPSGDKSHHLVDISARITFATGEGVIKVYDGTSSGDTLLRDEQIWKSNRDAKADIPEKGYCYGTTGSAMRVDVVSTSTWVTAGKLNVTAYLE